MIWEGKGSARPGRPGCQEGGTPDPSTDRAAARVLGAPADSAVTSQRALVIRGVRREGGEMEQSPEGQSLGKLERSGISAGAVCAGDLRGVLLQRRLLSSELELRSEAVTLVEGSEQRDSLKNR